MIEVAVTIRPGESVGEAARRLEAAGLEVEHRLEAIGSVTGRVAADRIAGLRAVAGVTAVETIAPIQIAPPDAEVQ